MADLWQLGTPPLELVLRSVIVYAVFLAALRISGKRELGQFTTFDLALVLLVANALQPAITGPDNSLLGATIIIATLFALNRIVAYGRSHFKVVGRILDYPATVIAKDGDWDQKAIEREGLSEDDLQSAIRDHGLDSIDEVKLAVLEHDGSISVVPKDDDDRGRMRVRRRRYRTRGPNAQSG